MMRRQYPICLDNPSRLCPPENATFLEEVVKELEDPSRPPECFFNTTVRPSATYMLFS